jgi:hypothetical protein
LHVVLACDYSFKARTRKGHIKKKLSAQAAWRLTPKGVSCRSTHHAIRKEQPTLGRTEQLRIPLVAPRTMPSCSGRTSSHHSIPATQQSSASHHSKFHQQPNHSLLDTASCIIPCTASRRTINTVICWIAVVVFHTQSDSVLTTSMPVLMHCTQHNFINSPVYPVVGISTPESTEG